jgi:hypothetical protein
LDGIAGAGRELDDAGAQQLILPPQSQQAWAGWPAHSGRSAAGNCAHTSSKPNKMANNRFTG